MRAILAAVLLGAGVSAAQTAPRVKPDAPPPKNVLWVGNSFFYYHAGLARLVSNLLDKAVPRHDFQFRMVTINGAALSWHDLDVYLRPGQMQGFSISADNTLVLESPRPFDAVLLQDCSQCPVHPKLAPAFFETVRKDATLGKSHGARTLLFMTWAYADKPEMTAALAEAYTQAGNEVGALVVPVGLAFAAARAKEPSVDLYDPDKRHPSFAGSYLAACTVLATVYGISPVGNGFTKGLDAKTAHFLQAVAAETVASYFGKTVASGSR
jgi:uncharacterized protein DUF4886